MTKLLQSARVAFILAALSATMGGALLMMSPELQGNSSACLQKFEELFHHEQE